MLPPAPITPCGTSLPVAVRCRVTSAPTAGVPSDRTTGSEGGVAHSPGLVVLLMLTLDHAETARLTGPVMTPPRWTGSPTGRRRGSATLWSLASLFRS